MIKKSLVKRVAVIGCLAIGAMTFVACGSAGGAKNFGRSLCKWGKETYD